MRQLSTPAAVIIGSLLISISILVSGGIVRFKKPSLDIKGNAAQAATPAPSIPLSEKLVALAKNLSLNSDEFKKCIESKKSQPEINKDIADAGSAGITGTPGFIIGKSSSDGKINGIRVTGAYPIDVFKTIFDEMVSGKAIDSIIKDLGTKYPQGVEAGSTTVDDDPVLGDKDAPVTLVEFSDYECPFCKRHFTQTLPTIKSDYIDKGKVKLVYRDFIAVPSHNPAANDEAIAANCARDQGGDSTYFKFHDEIFTRTQANGAGI